MFSPLKGGGDLPSDLLDLLCVCPAAYAPRIDRAEKGETG